MSPPPPEKGKNPIAGDAASSDEDSRRHRGSSHTPDVETADAHVGTGRADSKAAWNQKPSLTLSQPTVVGAARRKYGRHVFEEETGVCSSSQNDRPHRVQFPSMDLGPAAPETPPSVQLSMSRKKMKKKKRVVSERGLWNDEITDPTSAIAPGSLSNAEAKGKYRRSEPSVSKDLDLGMFEPQFLSEISVELKPEEVSEPFDQPGRPSPGLIKASRPTKSGKEFDSSSSGTENETSQEVEEPSKKVQRIIVDRVMFSFMNWLDTKLKYLYLEKRHVQQ
ncbi:hypothetical protein ColTof3_13604 [Colletotrichum tofieldiae]|nr:hypothetical protein ColTof3_13604 [Colletotrichum tofieldiae]